MRVAWALLLSGLAAALPSSKYSYLLPRQSPPAPISTVSTFDPLSASNLVVYYGKAQNNANPSLYDLCVDEDVDVIVMGFVRQLNGAYKQPTFDINYGCKSNSKAPNGTVTCPTLAANITFCQNMGKKVMMSLGGSSSNLTLKSATEAQQAANILWNIFGAGFGTPTLRPFGNVTLDGFDFDLEAGASTNYTDTLAQSLQTLYSTSQSPGYISAAPLCANNTIFPASFYANANFVWPRFYNARACCVGSKGFNASVTKWSSYLSSIPSNLGPLYPKFYIGGLSFNNSNSGYVTPDAFANATLAARKSVGQRFGGVSLWQGTDGLVTKNGEGRDFLNVTKEALEVSLTSGACGGFDGGVLGVLKLIRRQMSSVRYMV